jgi:hypothetical protein
MLRRFKISATLLLFAVISLLTPRAEAFIEINLFYDSDALSTPSSASDTKTYYEACLGFGIDSKGRYLVGWDYSSFSKTDSGTTSSTYTSTQMGPRFIFMFGKDKQWSLGVGYYLVTTGDYNASNTDKQLTGTAFKVDAGYNFPMTDDFMLGIRLNYSAATYTSQLVGGSYSGISDTVNLIYPSVYAIAWF